MYVSSNRPNSAKSIANAMVYFIIVPVSVVIWVLFKHLEYKSIAGCIPDYELCHLTISAVSSMIPLVGEMVA